MLKNIVFLVVGLALGAAGGGGYMYSQLDAVKGGLAIAQKSLADRDGELQKTKADLAKSADAAKQAAAAKETAEASLKQAATDMQTLEASLKQAVAAKEAAEAAAKRAEAAKAEAEKALADAKKPQ